MTRMEKRKGVCNDETGGQVQNKTMQVYLGDSQECGLYPQKNERLLKGFKQVDEVTIICFKMAILENRLEKEQSKTP